MAIIPIVRCRNLRRSVEFYTRVLDFALADASAELDDPSFVSLSREGGTLFLSSHTGDGEFGQAIVVTTDDVDRLFLKFQARGLVIPDRPESPVHQGPVTQTWGTREWCVDDADGNKVTFMERPA